MRQRVTDYLSDHNISFSAKQTMFWEALYELYRAPLRLRDTVNPTCILSIVFHD